MINFNAGVRSAELVEFLDLFMSQARQKVTNVQQQKDDLGIRTAVFNDLKTKLTDLKRKAEDIAGVGSLSPFQAKLVANSDESVLRVTATNGAETGAHQISVQQVAKPHTVLSNQYTRDGNELSTQFSGAQTFSIVVDGTPQAVNVDITAGATNDVVLDEIARAINATPDLAASASRVRDTDGTARLTISSSETGSANSMTFEDTSFFLGMLSQMGVMNGTEADATTGGYVYADLGGGELDAKLTLDGIAIQRGSNTLSDIIGGATIDILRAQEATEAPTAIDISADTETVKASVQEFLDSYNDSYAYLQAKVRIDQTTYERGALAGDFSYKSLWLGMRSTLANSVTMTDPDDPTSLGLIGITAGRDGVFTITDEAKLFEMVAEDPEMLAEMFNDTTGIGLRVDALIERYVAADGVIENSKDSVVARRDGFDRRLDSLERQNKTLENRLIQQFGALQEARNLIASFQATLASIGGFLG